MSLSSLSSKNLPRHSIDLRLMVCTRVERTFCGNIKRGKDGNRIKTKQTRKKGRVIEDFLKKHGLSHHIAPAYFVSPFLPFKSNGYSTCQKEQIRFDFLRGGKTWRQRWLELVKVDFFITVGKHSALGSYRRILVFTYLMGWLLHPGWNKSSNHIVRTQSTGMTSYIICLVQMPNAAIAISKTF